jgi:glycosyltransferase involved in cell wall biosynthesis
MKNFISIVIPTYNRADLLIDVLPSYMNQSFVKEIIIIDDNSSDDTESKILKYSLNHKKIKYIKNIHRLGTCGTKNVGLRKSSGSFVFIGEDDLELCHGFIKTLYHHLIRGRGDVISGRRIWIRENESKSEAISRAEKSRGQLNNKSLLTVNFETHSDKDESLYLLDASMLMRERVAKKVEFDTKLFQDPVAWRNESDFQLSAIQNNYKLMFCPHAYSLHHSRKLLKLSQIKKKISYDYLMIKNNYLFYKKHKDFIKNTFRVNGKIFILMFSLYVLKNFYLIPLIQLISYKSSSVFKLQHYSGTE